MYSESFQAVACTLTARTKAGPRHGVNPRGLPYARAGFIPCRCSAQIGQVSVLVTGFKEKSKTPAFPLVQLLRHGCRPFTDRLFDLGRAGATAGFR